MRIALAACILLLPTLASAQSEPVQEVGLCQLRQHATEFDHKVVRVRGTVDLAFENFTLYDTECIDWKSTAVWLTFGGDVSGIATYCCGDHSREPGHFLEIDNRPIPLVKDAPYEQFHKLVYASRNRMPNGDPCLNDCHFYRVSATLTGLFLAERNTGNQHIGYGHLGCCSLLVIQKVSDVSAQRTPVPLGAFNCEQSTWEPKGAPEFENFASCSTSCDQKAETALEVVAAHWNDNVAIAKGRTDRFGDITGPRPIEHLNWFSGDLLTSYAIVADRSMPRRFSVTRESCRSMSPQASGSPKISCDEYAAGEWDTAHRRDYEQLIDKDDYTAAENMLAAWDEAQSSHGDQSWRAKALPLAADAVLRRQLRRWGIAADPNLSSVKCSGPESLDVQRYGYASCSWYSQDGMQEFGVVFLAKRISGTSTASPWLLNSVSARICHADPSLATANVQPN